MDRFRRLRPFNGFRAGPSQERSSSFRAERSKEEAQDRHQGRLPLGTFGGLYWRLILSYFLVTLVAVLTIEAAIILSQIVRGYQSYSQSTPLEVLLQKEEAPKIAPYLTLSNPNPEDLRTNILIPLLNRAVDYVSSSSSFAMVLDGRGQTLTASYCTWLPSSSPSAELLVPTGKCQAASTEQVAALLSPQPVQAALQGVRASQAISAKSVGRADAGGKVLFVVVPVQSASTGNNAKAGSVVGEVVLVFQNPVSKGLPIASQGEMSFGDFLSEFLGRLDPVGFYFLLLATAVGTLAGVLISRNLTRRLRHIAQTTGSWSRGQLDTRVQDRSRDEIGELAQDLNSMAGQLQSLMSMRQQLAVVDERNRLARELHDAVKQQVFANALLVRAARKVLARNPQVAEKYLQEAEELADEAQQGLVELIGALRPASVADKGLAVVLREYATEWSERMGITIDVRIQGERPTPLEVEEALYRVGQEALANIARHSGAQGASLQLEWESDQLRLTVADNGKGFDVKRSEDSALNGIKGKGLGLASMRERVEGLHGTLTLSSSPAGTIIRACVPLATVKTAVPGAPVDSPEQAEVGKGSITK